MASDKGPGLEAGRKPECLGKQKRFQNMINLSRIWRIRMTSCGFRRAKDECGTMNDELKKAGSQKKK
jgi:hypothetical protein